MKTQSQAKRKLSKGKNVSTAQDQSGKKQWTAIFTYREDRIRLISVRIIRRVRNACLFPPRHLLRRFVNRHSSPLSGRRFVQGAPTGLEIKRITVDLPAPVP